MVYAAIPSQQFMTLIINIGEITSDYMMRMDDVLDQYEQSHNPKHPLICMDEMPCQLIDDVLVPIPPEPGKSQRVDSEYRRNGACCVFIAFDPHAGMRMIT
jgi:hypothetical protein